ncbi:NAD(P)/FAD-dependent oxidoreductase [Polyangium spumosum]|uniref:Pyridine nucleotide-disulfide oxidoreductase n=1 Tax=Polyangium spumosum TaxID=889282 RepID=A0A6N7PH82_9BACT|nr:FAD/NAD(P)-binding oxidoreductase [Polyangium spumosum]MRG91147.1 pyridine nucleotide-disulfide oxidoreductase [Polyangium spumosum]
MATITPASTSTKNSRPRSEPPAELGRARVVIIGGGTAGISVAARLSRAGVTDLAIIEPSEKHYYQPLWTLVGAGVVSAEQTERDEAAFIPDGARWIKDFAEEIDPVAQTVRVRGGGRVGYDFLVVAPGIQLDWDAVPGLREALQTESVSSNYDVRLAPKTWRLIESFRGGTAIFTHPAGPIKCAGAPQKIAYLACDHWRKTGILDRSDVIFGSAQKSIFGVTEFRVVLEQVIERYGIQTKFERNLVEVNPDRKEAVFAVVGDPSGARETIRYDIMHAVPPQSAPDFIKRSPIAHADGPNKGWAKADKHTMQNPEYPNVFALGDASELPTSRTGAAIRKEAPVLVENLLAVMNGKEPTAKYDGYASCPLVTSYDTMLLAEFDYSGKPTPSIPLINTQKERHDMYLLKRYGLPWMYWNLMLRGLS